MKRKIILSIISIIAAITAVISVYMIFSTIVRQASEQKAFDELSAIVEQSKKSLVSGGSQQSPTAEKSEKDESEPVILAEYAAIYEQNSDFFGWLSVDETPISYPVMHTPSDPQYYLRRAFDKSDAQTGTPFLDGACFQGCGNYIIYGHHMKNGTLFGTLSMFDDRDYWEEHKMLSFDTLYEHGQYEIFAAFYCTVNPDVQHFRYYTYTDLTDPVIFEEYLAQVREAAIYDTVATVEYGDELITLSTCSYHTADGRFVVVAKRINSGALD